MQDLIYDHQEMSAEFDDDLDILEEVIETFLEERDKMLKEVDGAIAAKDSSALETSAHTIKGALAVFRAKAIVETALDLEIKGRSGDWAEVPEKFAMLKTDVMTLSNQLSEYLRTIRASA